MFGILTRSILGRVLAALLSIYAATYLATAVVIYSGVRASLLESDASALNQLADLKYRQLLGVINGLATNLTAWSKLDVMNDLASGDIDKRVANTFEELKQLYDLPGDIYAFDRNGKLLATSTGGSAPPGTDLIPPEWQSRMARLVLVDKEADPMTGREIIALEIPVYGSFDPGYRLGTLVMTYPWKSVESLLFGLDNATILLDTGDRMRVLAVDPPGIVDRVGPDRIREQSDGVSGGFVVGRSVPQRGLIGNWQVVTLHSTDSAIRSLHRVAIELLLLGGFLGIPIVLLGRWLSGKLTAPIADLTRVVSEIAATDRLDARAPVPSTDELGSLARSFNQMTDNLERTTRERETYLRDLTALNQTLEAKIAARTEELEAAVKAQQRLIGDISHEIKSPLARLSMAVGLAQRSAEADRPRQYERMEREIDNISALATELLTLARLDSAAAAPAFDDVDAAALVEQIVADAVFENPGRAADVIVHKPDSPVIVVGNADLLRRAIENIVRNAMFYTEERTKVEVTIAPETSGTMAITVLDHGPGVPEAALAHLFEPFYRVDEARARETGGTGVGLAICHRVVQLHGGTITARNNRPHGLSVRIVLPSAA